LLSSLWDSFVFVSNWFSDCNIPLCSANSGIFHIFFTHLLFLTGVVSCLWLIENSRAFPWPEVFTTFLKFYSASDASLCVPILMVSACSFSLWAPVCCRGLDWLWTMLWGLALHLGGPEVALASALPGQDIGVCPNVAVTHGPPFSTWMPLPVTFSPPCLPWLSASCEAAECLWAFLGASFWSWEIYQR
jgi:hypothetical protein